MLKNFCWWQRRSRSGVGLHSRSPLSVRFDVYMYVHFSLFQHFTSAHGSSCILSDVCDSCNLSCTCCLIVEDFHQNSLSIRSWPWPLSLLADGIYLGGIYQGVNVLMSFPCPLLQALMIWIILTKESHTLVQQHSITYCILYHYWYNGCFVLFLSPQWNVRLWCGSGRDFMRNCW